MGEEFFRRLLRRGHAAKYRTEASSATGPAYGLSGSNTTTAGRSGCYPLVFENGMIDEVHLMEPFPNYRDQHGILFKRETFIIANSALKQRAMVHVYFADSLYRNHDFGRWHQNFLKENGNWIFSYAERTGQ